MTWHDYCVFLSFGNIFFEKDSSILIQVISQFDKKLHELCIAYILTDELQPNSIELLTGVKLEVLKLTVIYV